MNNFVGTTEETILTLTGIGTRLVNSAGIVQDFIRQLALIGVVAIFNDIQDNLKQIA